MKSSIAWDVHRVAATASTMDDAKAAARAGASEGWAIVAESMAKGRGTLDHTWHAPVGGFYTSFIVREPGDLRLLTLALGTAVCDVLEVAGVEAQIKWVNDVLVGDRKIAGILVESESTGERLDFAVCGIGINLNGHASTFPADLRGIATTLEDELECEQCIPDVEAIVWERVAARIEQLRSGDRAIILADFAARDALRGKTVIVDDGRSTLRGVASGLDALGRLVLRDGGVEHHALGGTVRVL